MASSTLTEFSNSVRSDLNDVLPEPGMLTIQPIKMIKGMPIPIPVPAPFIAMFNPEQYSEQINVDLDCSQASGGFLNELKFILVEQSDVSFDLILDGTGASGGEKKEVSEQIALFRLTTGFNGNRHMTNYVVLIWGTFIFYGFLKTLNIQYTLFRADGTPLRAKLSCSFKASTPKVLSLLMSGLFSPDLTREHRVKAGDRLDVLSQRYYDSPRHHISIAQANGLTSIRTLPEGSNVFLPPLEK